MSTSDASTTTGGVSVAALLFATVLLFVFGAICSSMVRGSDSSIMLIIGLALALASGYAAVAVAKAVIPKASLNVIAYGLVAIVAVQFLFFVSSVGPRGSLAYVCSIVGAILAANRRPATV